MALKTGFYHAINTY